MKIKLINNDNNCIPTKAHVTDAGYDMRASRSMSVFPRDTEFIPTGVCVDIPVGYVGLLFPRSSISKTPLRMPNSCGVIDAGYKGEIKVPVWNSDEVEIIDIDKYDRIAQLVIIPCMDFPIEVTDDLGTSERGEGGFGSTGK